MSQLMIPSKRGLVPARASRGWFARLRQSIRSITLGPYNTKDKTLARIFGQGGRSLSGVPVTEDTAFNYSAFWQGVGLISGHIASFPLIHYKRLQPKGKDRFVGSRIFRMLRDEFNPHMSSFVAREVMQAHVLTWGNAYAEIERDRADQPVALWPLTPDRVEPFYGDSGGVFYRVSGVNASDVIIPARDMLHIPGLGFDGLQGYGVVRRARESIGLGIAAEKFGAAFFGNGSTFGGVLTPEDAGALQDEADREELREAIEKFHQGVDRAHRFLILYGGLKYQSLGVPPKDSQFLETRKFQVEEIARWLNLPPHKLKHLDRSTNNNIEHQGIEYYTDTLFPWQVRWEQELNRKLISPLERNQQFIEHLPEAVLRGDIESRYKAYSIGRQWGWLSADDIRERENMNPLPDGIGTIYLVPLNMTPANRINDVIDAQIAKDTKPAAPPAVGGGDRDVEAIVGSLRDEMQAIAQRAEEQSAKAAAAESALANATTDADALRQTVEEARAAEARLRQELTEKAALLAVATKQLHQAQLAREADQAVTDALAAEAATRVAAADKAIADATARAATVEAERDQLIAELGQATEREQEAFRAMEAAVQRATEANAAVATSQDAQVTLDAARAAAEQRAGEAITALDAAQAALAQAEQRALDATAAADTQRLAAEQALHARRQTELARLTGVLAAHRGLIVDAMGRMVRRETEKARRHQATPEKLRAWMDAFYVTHHDTCVDAIVPAITANLAWRLSGESPAAVADGLVRDHISESVRQLRAVLDGTEPEDFAVTLERMLQRWEQDRPNELADRLLREEIEYVRSYQ